MNATARLDLRLKAKDKDRITRAADLRGMPVSIFVRNAALKEAQNVVTARSRQAGRSSLSAHLRGRATARTSTDEIMRFTRDV